MAAASYYDTGHLHHDNRLGGHAFNHGPSSHAESHYDGLRTQARQAHDRHDFQAMNRLNQQASEFIFRENNAPGRVKDNEIDLHGQFVHEAENILEIRIEEMQRQQQPTLHVIVGKGNHSPGHIQKIKPAVEKLCRERSLRFETEPNEGRIRVHLQPGGGGGQQGGYEPYQQPQYGQQQPHHGQPGKPQQQFQSDEQKLAQNVIKQCIKSCCTVM